MSAVILSGLFLGLVYGLLGVGLTVTYRASRVINFAYAETGMLGAFLFNDLRFGTNASGLVHDNGLRVALPVALLAAAGLGALTELLAVRPLRHAPRIRPLVATFAIGILFFTFAARRWGFGPRAAGPLIPGDGIQAAGLLISPGQVLILVVSIAVPLGFWALYRFTSHGLRLRATAIDPYAAGLVGVNVNRTSTMTWALAGALAGLSGILIAPVVAFNVAFMTTLSIRGLAAALVGGLTNIPGALAAGVLIGVAEAVIGFKTPVGGATDVVIACLVLTVVLVRPAGFARSRY
jgi:branched-chain amino acid transport system permease protein